MKKIFSAIIPLAVVLLLLGSCNEALETEDYTQGAPSITGFSPTSGPVGTLITVEGENLQTVSAATLNGGAVTLKSRISGTRLIVQTTHTGSTGKLKLVSPEGEASSEATFTYIYNTPSIATYPEGYVVGENAIFFGTDLGAILGVKFGDMEAAIIDATAKELIVTVPNLRVTQTDITFTYFDGTANAVFVKQDAQIIREVPNITSYSPQNPQVGETVTLTGQYLHLVDRIMVGDVEAYIQLPKPENGLTLQFHVVDDPSFADGANTLSLKTYAMQDEEIFTVDANFTFSVPKFYTWKNRNLNAHSIQKLNHLFCLDTGITYTSDDFAEKVDPLTIAKGGEVCSGKNILATEVTEEEYYAVKPYIFMAYLGSGSYFYGPANNNNRLSNFKLSTAGNPAMMTSGKAYGTPIILYRTLSTLIPAENAIIEKIHEGSFTSNDFTPAILDDIDLTQTGAATADSWSNIPNGEFGAFKAAGTANHRPWAPQLTTATEKTDLDPGTVVLVMYFKPNWTSPFAVNKANIHKFGFLEVTRLVQDSAVESGRQNNVTFNVYWQRTPMQ